MKKFLLLVTALFSVAPAFAAAPVDVTSYDEVGGLTLTNKWLYCADQDVDAWNEIAISASNYSRMAAIDPNTNQIYVTISKNADATEDYGYIYVFDLNTGALLEDNVALTVDGEPLYALLCANNVGVDDYGHPYVVGYTSNIYDHPATIYQLDPVTGALTAVGTLELPADEFDAAGRIDYFHIIGDITGENADALCMGASSEVWVVYRWRLAQGTSEWVGDFDGYVTLIDFEDTYPSGNIEWGTGPTVTIVKDDEVSGDFFYVDGFVTCPTLYNTSGAIVESFASVSDPNVVIPAVGTNGVAEFSLAGEDFVVYSEDQYVSPGYCAVSINKLGDGQSFDGMTHYWSTCKLGDVSDGGNRVHSLATKSITDENGLEGVLLLNYKTRNGLGVYLIAQEGFVDPDAGVANIAADAAAASISVAGKVISVSAPASVISVYNISGQKVAEVKNAQEVAAPATGAYIVKAVVDGAAVVAKVII